MLDSFWVDQNSADIDTGEYGVNKETATEVMDLLFSLTTDKKENIIVKPGNFVKR